LKKILLQGVSFCDTNKKSQKKTKHIFRGNKPIAKKKFRNVEIFIALSTRKLDYLQLVLSLNHRLQTSLKES
jgi:hypothetical protein